MPTVGTRSVTAPVRAPAHVNLTPSAPASASQSSESGQRSRPSAAGPTLANYYGPAQGKQGAELLRSLHQIVRYGHVDRGYAQARDALFDLVEDPTRTDTVVDVYSGRSFPGVDDRRSAFSNDLNAEHTWPQSKGARGIAQSDLHQLMASDVETNAQRGSHPYGEVDRPTWSNGEPGSQASVLGTDAQGRVVFEPRDSVKGDIARALLYFYVRYHASRPARFSVDNFRVELPNLLRWHTEDPVDERERRRNDEVFQIQRNRNPFVDHPEFVGRIGFERLQPLR